MKPKPKRNRYRTHRIQSRGLLRRWLKGLAGITVFLAAVILLSAAFAHSFHAIREAPWLRVEDVQIIELKHLQRRDILNVLQVPRNASILSFKLSDLAKRMESLPWVRSSVVRLDIPGRLVVELEEREPVAIVRAKENFLLDLDGKLFVKSSQDRSQGLLLVTGLEEASLAEGGRLPLDPWESLKELLPALNKSKKWLGEDAITECQWHGDDGFVLHVSSKPILIHLGYDGFDLKLSRLQRIFKVLNERQRMDSVTRIDLDYPHRAFVEGNVGSSSGA